MITRYLQDQIIDGLASFPAVALVGSRQAGKTTLAGAIRHPDAVYLDLERPSDLARLEDAEGYLHHHRERLVIIDEAQRKPELFPLLRALIDADRRPGRFLILGSASPDLRRQAAESLAGRIKYFELSPFLLGELSGQPDPLSTLWWRGGYPLSFLADSDRTSHQWREAFLQTFLERDLAQWGYQISAQVLYRFWTMLGHVHGQLWNASKIAGSLGVSSPTARRYLDMLCDTFMVRLLLPYHTNLRKRLIKTPKVYLRDTGLLHALLGLDSLDSLLAHPVAGHSWEGLIIEQIIHQLPVGYDAYFYGTVAGAEIDLLITRQGRPYAAVEVKRTSSPSTTRSLTIALGDLGLQRAFIVYPGDELFPMRHGVIAYPAPLLGAGLQDLLGLEDEPDAEGKVQLQNAADGHAR
ncbi:MAG: DUF4143 domain-containing protein [Candidatus Latescibacteria bacterium]|nr:DUF4143 domain-containing protein [Candidatus Latescibacterota bacterium]